MSTYKTSSLNTNSFNNDSNQVKIFNTQFIRTNRAQNPIHYQFMQWLQQKEPVYRKKQREEFITTNYLIRKRRNIPSLSSMKESFNYDYAYLNNSAYVNPINVPECTDTKMMNNTEREFLLLSDYLEMKGILTKKDIVPHTYNPILIREINVGIEFPIMIWPVQGQVYIQNTEMNQNVQFEQNYQFNLGIQMNEETVYEQPMNYTNEIEYNSFPNYSNQINFEDTGFINEIDYNEQNNDIIEQQRIEHFHGTNDQLLMNTQTRFNWIIDPEKFIRKQTILESSRIWDNKSQWNLVRCNKNIKQLLLHTEYYLNPDMINTVENLDLGEYLHDLYYPENYLDMNCIYQTYTIFESIDILELIFGKDNIMLGYTWERIDNTLKFIIRLYISDIRSYVYEHSFRIPRSFFNGGTIIAESEKPIFFQVTEKAILFALINWFPFLRE